MSLHQAGLAALEATLISAIDAHGKFCETYHLNASGWRCCESCGKKIHCGCIVSFHMFILLDAGGIECLNCAKTEYILTPNPTWPSASHSLHGPAERIRDESSKHWRCIAGSDPVPWRQAPPSLFNSSSSSKGQHELQLISCSLGQSKTDDPCERFVNDSWRVSAPEIIGDRAQATGIRHDGKHNLFNDESSFQTHATTLSSLPETFVAHDRKNEIESVSGIRVQQLCPPPSVGKESSINNGAGTSLENQAHNVKAQGETRARHQLLPRYCPQFTDQELQQLCGGSNAKITPLFEKAYLPPISEPEGYPLVIQDLKGKDWVLQYRFWSNNNSRMYVLEGVTPWIQSMQLQAGDTVTFSRLEPEGKLIMGFRKAPLVSPSNKDNETTNTSISTHKVSLSDKSRNPDGTWSEVDKISIHAKRKDNKVCSNSKHNVTLKQVQGLLRPPLAGSPTIVLIDGVEFENFQEAPIIGSPTEFSTDNAGSLRSAEVEATPEHHEHKLPMIDHGNPESSNTMEGLIALGDLADHDGKAATIRHPRHKHGCTCIVCIQPPSGSKHKSTCSCNVCLAVKHSTPPPPRMQPHSEKQVENSVQNPTQLLYADKAGAGQTFENDLNREISSNSSFKTQNIDLNIQPEREEEYSPVSDSMGIMKIVQESTQRYINLQKASVNGITDGNHTNHYL
ncbi:hypothetical protein M8C21_022718 [Ambrosia artemisiifolia]|uniref:TF-B3 domain-containing protein n=1 Tax=Ambrosia artemisiifolia TaxID=4212 RepID=A0AAD5C814_AMBAR|nr:hypothetical protein M8C21_022718 [Ambrosia artemisiifolia]